MFNFSLKTNLKNVYIYIYMNTIKITDFNLFVDIVKSSMKVLDSAKFILSENGLEIYGARSNAARCEITSNSVFSDGSFSFCIEKMQVFHKILQTVKDIHENDYSALKMSYDCGAIVFKSPKFKNKFRTCSEDIIEKWVSKKIEAKMESLFAFTTSSEFIKRINGHSFIFSDPTSAKVYIETKDDMEANVVYSTLGDKSNSLNNEITMKFGLVTNGMIPDGRHIIIDLERLNLLNSIDSKQIDVQLMNYNVLLSKTKLTGKNDSYFNMNTYISLIKN